MPIALSTDERSRAADALRAHLRSEFDVEAGTVAADALLDLILTDLMPLAYNRGVADAQARVHAHADALATDLYEPPFVRSSRG
jgi:uncharacterized protein (DUF2164 family)